MSGTNGEPQFTQKHVSPRQASETYNLAVVNPPLASEWHPTRNEFLTPMMVKPNSNKKVWWKCSYEHEWKANINSRHRMKLGCPYCAGKRASEEYNLQTENSELASEWHPVSNGGKMPFDFTPNSSKKVWWICKNGHSFEASICNRNSHKRGCPYCSGKKPSPEYNLLIINPELAKEWHPTKNYPLTPEKFTPSSGKMAWWKGSNCLHEWEAIIGNRHRLGVGCPTCADGKKTSFQELAIFHYLSCFFTDAKHHFKLKNDFELDIFIPSLNIGIEFDSFHYHGFSDAKHRDEQKHNLLGTITLIRVREQGMTELKPHPQVQIIEMENQKDKKEFDRLIGTILKMLGIEVPRGFINAERDSVQIEDKRQRKKVDESILSIYPEVAKYWDYDNNGGLRPEQFKAMSNRKVNWICVNCGESYSTYIHNRTRGNGHCKNCRATSVWKTRKLNSGKDLHYPRG